MLKNVKFTIYSFFIVAFILGSDEAESRIRMRKVTEAPRTCGQMSEDPLLSRPDKKILSTERHSLVFEDGQLILLRDKGEKICAWSEVDLASVAPINKFKFYIDEYKEKIYPFAPQDNGGVKYFEVSMKDCDLDQSATVADFETPKCEIPKKKSSKRKKTKSKS